MTGPRFVAPTPQALADCVRDLLSPFRHDAVDLVAGIDAMGFILGTGSLARSRQNGRGAVGVVILNWACQKHVHLFLGAPVTTPKRARI